MKIKSIMQKNASWVFLVVLVVLFSLLSKNFFTVDNAITILRQAAVNGIVAVGLAIILISGGIDLSTGSQTAVCGMICALLMVNHGWGFFPAMILAIVVNTIAFGLFNGLVIAHTNMSPLIATLGTMNIARGIAYLTNDGFTVYGLPESAKIIGQATIGKVPVSVIVLIVSLIVGNFILNQTTYGRMLFAIGANGEAARLSGIPTKAIKVSAYVVGSLFISLGGIVLMSRLNSGIPSAGTEIYIEVLAGCIIGGVSAKGGGGNMFRMIGGVLVMTVISNGMNLAGISEFWQYVAKGGILVFTVGADSYRETVASEKRAHTIRSSVKAAAESIGAKK